MEHTKEQKNVARERFSRVVSGVQVITTAERWNELVALAESMTTDRDRWKALAVELGEVLKNLVYLYNGKWYTGIIGDSDVTEEVGPVLSKLQEAQDE